MSLRDPSKQNFPNSCIDRYSSTVGEENTRKIIDLPESSTDQQIRRKNTVLLTKMQSKPSVQKNVSLLQDFLAYIQRTT